MKNDFSCEKCQNILFDYVSDLLDKKSAASVLAHISTCSDCKKKFDDINAMLSVMHAEPLIELPDEFDRVLHMNLVTAAEEIKESQKETWWRRFVLSRNWKSVAPVALAFVLVVSVTSTGLYQHFKNESNEFNMSGNENNFIDTDVSSPVKTFKPDIGIDEKIIQDETKTEPEPRIIDDAQNNNIDNNDNTGKNKPAYPKNNDSLNSSDDKDKNNAMQSGGVQTSVPDSDIKNENTDQDNSQQPDMNSADKPNAQADEEFSGDVYSLPEPAAIENNAEPPLKDSQKPASSGGGGGVSSSRMVDTTCSVTVRDVNAFLVGYGFAPLNKDAAGTTITIFESEFENFKAYAKKVGAELYVETEGNSGVVYITISEQI